VTATTTTSRRRTDPRGNRLLEIFAVVLLGLATVGTAWCGYQAARWNGEEGDLARQSSDLRIEAARLFGLATQAVAFDANLVAQYAQAVVDGETELQAFYRETLFRPQFLPVLDRWEAAIEAGDGPPPRLLEDEEYLEQELAGYEEVVAEAEALTDESLVAGENGDDYVLVTLLLATALFFAGVTTSFRVRLARLALLAGAACTIAYAAGRLADLPVA
jgi:hypothetical protein